MRTNERMRHTWSAGACMLALLALTIGTSRAEVPTSTAYHFSSHPMISGTVVTVNDHQMVVNTDQGEQVTLEVDSRTMAPRDLQPGMVMRTEFLALEDCRLYAQRIMPIRGGMSTQRLQAYANTHESPGDFAYNGRGSGGDQRYAAETRETRPQAMDEHSPGASVIATPTTADYHFSTSPMVSGKVISVNDHRLIVETEQGQKVALVMDSHTMVPGEVAPGTMFRAEFTPMKDGRYLAKRISRTDNGLAGREQAYAPTRDSDIALARAIPDCGFVDAGNTVTSSVERRSIVIEPSTPAPVVESTETLPQTAGSEPLMLLLGLLALGSAGLIKVARGRRVV